MDRYIYYRALVAQATEVQQRVRTMQQQLVLQTGVRCELKRRPAQCATAATLANVRSCCLASLELACI